MNRIKSTVWSVLNFLGIGAYVSLPAKSALKDYGWFLSYKKKEAVDKHGNPIPWYTYPFIDFLEPRLQPGFTVFEYGSGNSTRWLARKVSQITAVEHNREWFQLVQARVPANAKVIYRDRGEAYIQAVAEGKDRYQVIVVDGRDRVKCALYSIDYLSDDGVLILDNSEREWYQHARDILAQRGFRCLDFAGMTPIVPIKSTTSVFYRDKNCLNI